MKKILIVILPVLLILAGFNLSQSITVTGTVTDEEGKPLAFVTILAKGTHTTTRSDKNGNYAITVAGKDVVLLFMHTGYMQQEIKTKGRLVINVTLKPSNTALSEVVISGGLKKQERITGIAAMQQALPGNGSYPLMYENIQEFNTEGYDHISENIFLKTADNPLSTFSIDVDAASYSNVRRFLNSGHLPPAGAVRIEEMINYFTYEYPQPVKEDPFSFTTEMSACPWNSNHRLVLIGMQGKKIPVTNLPPSNLVFLIDVSGSMMAENKLPLVKSSLKLLTDQLREQDNVSIVVYAGAAGTVLPPTSGSNKLKIKEAIDRLEAGGSTAGGAGIRLAYKTANEHFNKESNNRVILCTDGDFNVGMSSDDEMERLIEKERSTGIFLTVLGYGMGNYKDSKMQKLADKGNGNHAYIDGINEAKKVLVNEFGGTLFTIAKDVKLQVEFNPAKVQGYRLIGYENRMLKKEDFNDDKKDAGELGSGHTVTALYEIIPAGLKSDLLKDIDKLKYQDKQAGFGRSKFSNEIMTIKFRYKTPSGSVSRLIENPVHDNPISIDKASENFRFAGAVAEFGLLLRNSEFKAAASYDSVLLLSQNAMKNDKEGYKAEFIRMVEKAKQVSAAAAMIENR